MIEAGGKIYRAKKVGDVSLFTTADKFGKRMVYGGFLRSEAADPFCFCKQAIVNLEICRHGHTLGHTHNVSRIPVAFKGDRRSPPAWAHRNGLRRPPRAGIGRLILLSERRAGGYCAQRLWLMCICGGRPASASAAARTEPGPPKMRKIEWRRSKIPMTNGIVYLVGAGPGDPGLATFRARELLAAADVVVYDYLVHPDLLTWCRAGCEKIYVGKQPHLHAIPQEEIESLLVARAREGKRVVRLKGGDPFVFGRGGEEARRLAAAGIPFEVVPGVTAALAAGAYAGIPLTQRNTSSALIFLTGHEDPEKHTLAIDWKKYGALSNATLAIYMGMGHLRDIMDGLTAGGLPPDTPAAVVQWASLGRQRSVAATAATLADRVEKAKLGPPAVVFVGEVVRHHREVDWFEHLPLFGRRIVVTRAGGQSGDLRHRLEALGAEVVSLPLIEIKGDADRETTVDVFEEIGGYDWLVFTSSNGVRHFFDLFFKAFKDLRSLGVMRIACVGETTARAVRDLHLDVEVCPKKAVAEELARALAATGGLDSAKVLVVTGNRNRDTLVKELEAARAIVDQFPVYRTDLANLADHPAADDFRRRGADAILFVSSSAVESYVAQAKSLQLGPEAEKPLTGSIGPVTSESMRKTGMTVDFEAGSASLEALVAALVKKLGNP